MATKFLNVFRAARRVSTPLICVRTPDPAATIQSIAEAIKDFPSPLVSWDIIRGLAGLNDEGREAAAAAIGDGDPALASGNPAEALSLAVKLPKRTMLFMANAHRYLGNEAVSQAVWNLRDLFKTNFRTLVMLCPGIRLPQELTQDVLVLDEPLPTAEDLAGITKAQFQAAELAEPDEATLQKAVDATCGLAAFPAEQVTAMSLTKAGLDLEALWERKRQTIGETPGLSVWRGGESFSDIGGVENVKTFLRQVLEGREPPRAIVFLDEIEKAIAGAGGGQAGDTSGVSQAMLGTLLTWMQDTDATGVICIGPPGSAKSMVAKAAGNTAGIPTIAFDLGGMKASLVGESEERLRGALKVVSAVSQGRALFIATCNSLAVLPPELRRRFTFGTFFFDLPSAEERDAIWRIYVKKYEIAEAERPGDAGWTGAEIKQCCNLAWRLRCTLTEAAQYIVPVARSAADQIERLRTQANGRFVSASHTGVYRYDRVAQTSPGARKISTE